MISADSTRLWTLSDGHAGNVRQADALARALGIAVARDLRLRPDPRARLLAPRWFPGAAHALGRNFADAHASDPPGLAIGCGRQAALATRLLRARGSRTVQILDPRIDPAHWDLVIAPEHDGLAGGNVIPVLGSLHPVDDAWLAKARAAFPHFADLPQPRTAVLLGGSSRHVRFARPQFELLAAMLENMLADDGGSVLLTASRRTDPQVRAQLRHRYAETPGLVWLDADDGPNPYPGFLAWADRIVCSPDSVNMVSEACATRAPVYVYAPESVDGRPRRFLDALLARGRILPMAADLAPLEAEPLRETARVAQVVRDRLGLPG